MVNLRSIRNKEIELDELLLSESPDVLLCTETWLSDGDPSFFWFPKSYHVYRKDRQTRGGGVLIAVKDTLCSEEITLVGNNDIEACWCKVKTDSDIFWFACFYSPPEDKRAIDVFCEQAKQTLPANCRNVVLAGDFNLPELKWHDEHWRTSCGSLKPDSLQNLVDEFGLEQIVEVPTRGGNCLDLIFTSVVCAKESVSAEAGVSDHLLVRTVFPTTLYQTEVKPKIMWRYDKADWEKINIDLESLYATFVEGVAERTVNENWLIFKSDISSSVEKHTKLICQ